jgi:hypothetical protein
VLDNVDAFQKLRTYQPTIYQVDVLLNAKRLFLVFPLEAWEALLAFDLLLHFAKEIVVAILQTFHSVLQRLTAYFT